MSNFEEAVQQERMRLMAFIAEANDKIAELQDQVASDEQRIEALDAYDSVKSGKSPSGKSAKKAPRRSKAPPAADTPQDPAED
jgi:hypothetical protein